MNSSMKIYPIIGNTSLIEAEGKYFIQNTHHRKHKIFLCLTRSGMVHLKCWSTLRIFIKECIDRFSCFDSDLQNFIKVTYTMPEIYTSITILKDNGLFLSIQDENSSYYSPSVIIALKDVDIFCDTIDGIIDNKISVRV